MGNAYVSNAGVFLIQTFFGLVLLVIMLRLLMQLVRADFYNPVSQFIVKVTNPLLVPVRRVVPGIAGIDMASVLLLLVVQCLELFLITLVVGASIQPVGLLVLAASELLGLLLKIYLFGILIQVVLSWVNPGAYNPVSSLLYQINAPLLRPAQRLLPPIHGFDLSPMLVIVGLQLISMLVLDPLSHYARSMA